MSTGDCVRWLERHDYPVPMRSRCVCCPYRSNADWLDLKTRDPDGFARAIAIDRSVRDSTGMTHRTYLHASRRPLDELDFEEATDRGSALVLECEGGCGL